MAGVQRITDGEKNRIRTDLYPLRIRLMERGRKGLAPGRRPRLSHDAAMTPIARTIPIDAAAQTNGGHAIPSPGPRW